MSTEKWLVSEPKTIDLPFISTAKLSLLGGRVDVLGTDEPTARVEVSAVEGRELLVSVDGGTLTVDHPQLRWDNVLDAFRSFTNKASATVTVLLPRSAEVKIGVVSADVLVSGMTGRIRVNTVSGDATVDSGRGELDLNSVGGRLTIRGHAGRVVAHTVSGDVSASGELAAFSCDGVSGDVFVDATIAPDRIDTNTVSGSTTLRLPAGAAARYTVNTVSGTAQLDGEVFKNIHGRTQSTTSGSTDGTWTDVRSNSVSGDIVVVRSATPAPSTATADTGAL
jgi:DUF4097 and DUF4098 domain-containing protein YvlB